MHPSVLLHFFHEWINMGGGEFALHLLMKLGEKLYRKHGQDHYEDLG